MEKHEAYFKVLDREVFHDVFRVNALSTHIIYCRLIDFSRRQL